MRLVQSLRMQQCCTACGNSIKSDNATLDALLVAMQKRDPRLFAIKGYCPKCMQATGEPWTEEQAKKIERYIRRRERQLRAP